MSAESRPNLDEYTARLIKHKARRLVGRFRYSTSDREDLEQELAMHVIAHLDQFDPARGHQNTFVSRIVGRKLISMIRQRCALLRDYRRTIAIDDAMPDENDDQLEPVDRRRASVVRSSDLEIDLADAVQNLDGEAQRMCRSLRHESIAETARRLRLTRGEGRDRIAKIRRLLTDAGLDVYVSD